MLGLYEYQNTRLPRDRPHNIKRMLNILFVVTANVAIFVCIFQFWWIRHLNSVKAHVANDDFDMTFGSWTDVRWTSPEVWDEDHQSIIRQVMPVAVHSHNDYTRRIPLWEALGSGCISVEADVHLHKSDLLVGHSGRSLERQNSLSAMYLEPLERLIKLRNVNTTIGPWKGIFERVPGQTVVLLIDFKSESQSTLEELNSQLEPLRRLEYLTYWDGAKRILGPLTIVVSGKAKFSDIMALDSNHRDIFFDAPLVSLHNDVEDNFTVDPPIYKFNVSNSYYASSELKDGVIARTGSDESSPASQDASNGQLEQAKDRGLISRYWGSAGPRYQTTEQIMWGFLIKVGIGILNMDDMSAVRGRTRGMGRLTIQEK